MPGARCSSPGVRRATPASHTAELLRVARARLAAARARSLLAVACGGRATRLSPHDLRDAEEQLFAVADRRAARDVAARSAGRLATSLAVRSRSRRRPLDETTAPHRRGSTRIAPARRRRPRGCRLARDHRGLAPAARDLESARSRSPGCSRPAAAAVVLAAGLLWPTGAGGPATADRRVRTQRRRPDRDGRARPQPTATDAARMRTPAP